MRRLRFATLSIIGALACSEPAPSGRFVLVEPVSSGNGAIPASALALDSQTGRLCYAVLPSRQWRPIEGLLCDSTAARMNQLEAKVFLDSLLADRRVQPDR